MNVEYMILSE